MEQVNHFIVTAGWLDDMPQIGTCFIDRARGSEIFSFEFDRNWLLSHPNLYFDPDLKLMPGRQYTPKGKTCFGFLSDDGGTRSCTAVRNQDAGGFVGAVL